jgi:dolichyl-diphosphooligosaccharide--protein glycosyltransferase
MDISRISPRLIPGITIALFFGISLYLRIVIPYDNIFVGEWIKFTSIDSYYFMRVLDNLVHNFPHLIEFDPYVLFPGGSSVAHLPFFVYLLASINWIISFGSPTQQGVDIVSVYFPAVVGALVIIPVYFIGKSLFNRWVGVIAAGIIAILPGEFLGRSILGFTDRDALEVFLTVLVMLFLILAVKSASQNKITFFHLRNGNRLVIIRPFVYSLLAGIFLGIYLLTWKGAFIFILIIFAYFIIQSVIDHLKGLKTEYLCFVGAIIFAISLVIFLPVHPTQAYLAPLIIALLTLLIFTAISSLMIRKNMATAYYPLALVGISIAGLAVFYAVNPPLLSSILRSIGNIFTPTEITLSIREMQPIFLVGGQFSLSTVWANFTTSIYLSLISIGIITYFVIKRNEADKTLFIVWSLVILVLTLAMKRFALFFAINVALLAGYFSWFVLKFAGFNKQSVSSVIIQKEKRKRSKKRENTHRGDVWFSSKPVKMTLAVLFVFFLVIFPNISPAINAAGQAPFAPSNAWCESLSWLKDNTPEPFDNSGFYYEIYERPFNYPDSAYGVVAWWDTGYWITRIAQRPPNCNPGGDEARRQKVASFFIASDEASANSIISKLGSEYIIIDYITAVLTPTIDLQTNKRLLSGKFPSLAKYAGIDENHFYSVYYRLHDDTLEPIVLFHPEYYRSLIVRLYNFNGQEVIPEKSTVISYENKIAADGTPYKGIVEAKVFVSYEEAESFIRDKKQGQYRIVGNDPLVSPISLEPVENYNLIYSSSLAKSKSGLGKIPEVKIFEYVKPSADDK